MRVRLGINSLLHEIGPPKARNLLEPGQRLILGVTNKNGPKNDQSRNGYGSPTYSQEFSDFFFHTLARFPFNIKKYIYESIITKVR